MESARRMYLSQPAKWTLRWSSCICHLHSKQNTVVQKKSNTIRNTPREEAWCISSTYIRFNRLYTCSRCTSSQAGPQSCRGHLRWILSQHKRISNLGSFKKKSWNQPECCHRRALRTAVESYFSNRQLIAVGCGNPFMLRNPVLLFSPLRLLVNSLSFSVTTRQNTTLFSCSIPISQQHVFLIYLQGIFIYLYTL